MSNYLNINFFAGVFVGIVIYSILDCFIINFIYLSNLDLFNNIFLTKKGRAKLKEYYSKK